MFVYSQSILKTKLINLIQCDLRLNLCLIYHDIYTIQVKTTVNLDAWHILLKILKFNKNH